VHSRFRPQERREQNEAIGHDLPVAGRIAVSTQAIEAGVDISARTLITDLAPWPSLVQRFGRCNRRGEFPQAEVYWLDLPELRRHASPYEEDSLIQARAQLEKLEGQSVAPANLLEGDETIRHEAVLRRRDLVGLFDTTPDLSGNYLDISRFVRGSDEMDVQVFWRIWGEGDPPEDLPQPQREELCNVPVGQIKEFLRNRSRSRQARRWDFLDGRWQRIDPQEVRPGQTLLLRAEDGGYSPILGWNPEGTGTVEPVFNSQEARGSDSQDEDPTSLQPRRWVPLARHSGNVREEALRILESLSLPELTEEVHQAVITAAHWHDAGKAHPVFQDMLLQPLPEKERNEYRQELWAKSNRRGGKHSHPYFRHEVASALALLQHASPKLEGWARDLAAYLAMAHHGKVRLSLRSLPSGNQSPDHQYLLGFPMKGKDLLPSANLGGDVTAPETEINLSIAQIGVTENGEPSWLERALALRDRLGPFRLAYLEALVRGADVRASIKEQRDRGEHDDQ
jgi:CRISPR-associated endonuclease/helicase Cas3